jgi:hypothetical protein
MNDVLVQEENKIEDLIYEIRGKQVMLDSDLARLYQCKNGTKEINQAVKNNPAKFPKRFSWILNEEETKELLVKNFDQKIETRGGKLKNIRVFTEQGVAMLATIIHSNEAIETSIKIMDAFVAMRHYIIENKDIYQSLNNINNKLLEHDKKFDYLFSIFDKKEQLFLKGEIYDSFSNFINIFKQSEKELIIIDPYADVSLLDIVKKYKCKITIRTKNNDRLSNIEIEKYNEQYHNLTVIRNNDFHDRYFIIDNKKIYQSGTSINNAGDKTFSINLLEDKFVKETILNEVNRICKTS